MFFGIISVGTKMWWLRIELFPGEKLLVRVMLGLLFFLRVGLLAVVYILAGVERRIFFPEIGFDVATQEDPARAVAAFVLPISAMLTLVVVSLRLRRVSFIVHSHTQWVLWTISLLGALGVFFGLIGIAAVSLRTNAAVSYVFACVWFLGSIAQTVAITLLNSLASLIAPMWLIQLRILLTGLVVLLALGVAVTVGWVSSASWILQILFSVLTIVFLVTFAHSSDFPPRSSCSFACPANVPPVPVCAEHHSLLLREVE